MRFKKFLKSFSCHRFSISSYFLFVVEEEASLSNGVDNVTRMDGMMTENECDKEKEKIDQSQQTTPTSPNTGMYMYMVYNLLLTDLIMLSNKIF